jgi:hypothetical protein
MRQIRQLVLVVVCAMMATMLAPPVVAAANNDQNPRVVDPQSHKALYETLAAEWWQWVFSTPNEPGGPFDAGRVDCAVNQPHSNVLFLAGPFNQSGTVDRTCTDPVDQPTQIFLPVINTECSDREDPPFYGATAKERRTCVNDAIFNPANLNAKVDGQLFPVSQAKFNIVSKDFAFTSVNGNPGIAFIGSGHSTTRGVWLLLEPLERGKHTIDFTGSYPALGFSLMVTYRLTAK